MAKALWGCEDGYVLYFLTASWTEESCRNAAFSFILFSTYLLPQMAEIDGRDAVEIICNTESVEKDELLLSLCKAFLTQQLRNGDMYYIW